MSRVPFFVPWLAEGEQVDHSTLSSFCKNFADLLRGINTQFGLLAHQMGVTSLTQFGFDGTRLRASNARSRTVRANESRPLFRSLFRSFFVPIPVMVVQSVRKKAPDPFTPTQCGNWGLLRLVIHRKTLRESPPSVRLHSMKTLNVSDVARRFGQVLDEVEHEQEEIVLVRNRRQVARLIPEPPQQNALEVLGDLAGTLDEKTADALSKAICVSRKGQSATLKAVRNPWAS